MYGNCTPDNSTGYSKETTESKRNFSLQTRDLAKKYHILQTGRLDFFWVLSFGFRSWVQGFQFKVLGSMLSVLGHCNYLLRMLIPLKESSNHYESIFCVTQTIIMKLFTYLTIAALDTANC